MFRDQIAVGQNDCHNTFCHSFVLAYGHLLVIIAYRRLQTKNKRNEGHMTK